MSSMLARDVFVVASVAGLIVLGLVIALGSGWDRSEGRDRPAHPAWDTLGRALWTLAGWGASLAAIQHVVGPRF